MLKKLAALIIAAVVGLVTFTPEVFAHGGGWRKDSPPGQCSHGPQDRY